MHGVKREQLSKDAKQRKRERDAFKISHYKQLTESVLASKQKNIFNNDTLGETSRLLDLNPEFYTAWNYRRDIITNHVFSELKDSQAAHTFILKELQFVGKQLKSYPKVYWIWNHRKWLIEQDDLFDLKQEMALIDKMLTMDSRNYHVWAYRRYIVGLVQSKMEREEDIILSNMEEFNYTTKLIEENISNYSAWHNRSQLLQKLLNSKTEGFEDKYSFLVKELSFLQNAYYTDPDDSAVWVYLRWLLSPFFLKDLPQDKRNSVLKDQLRDIKELNDSEIEDSGKSNAWCLKSISYVEKMMNQHV
ncbi:BA75_04573T0 [Komagataella pastoris]|uniref:Geranylgeranyl transferase type-2 subunit alpha n=1 Tax=Komagataella pastoris TaxID=4922 RepID=A0A1B2JJG2_PICPA|nr:BA75_04573T0 [Komagataella pastoris]